MAYQVNNEKFIQAHPQLAEDVIRLHGSLDWINKYSNEVDGKLTEMWVRNKSGELVDVTKRELARLELERAKEEYEKLREEA